MAYAKRKYTQSTKKKSEPVSSPVADEEHSKLIQWVNESDDATLASRETSEKCRRYYDSEQWTAQERSKLAAQKQAATVINRIKPKMDGLMGMESANRTTAKAQPRTPKHTEGATAATEAVRFVLQDNDYHTIRSEAWENLTIEGTGGVEVIAEDMGEGKDIRITVNNIMWDRIIYDPHSRRKDFSDARYLGQVVWMDYDEALEMYPDARDVLETMQSGSNTYDDKPRWMDNSRRRVKIVELYYYRPDGEIWYGCFTRGGWCKSPKKSPYINEEGETEWPYEFASLFVTNEGTRYGAAFQYLDVQDEINKRRSKALHLMSVRQTFGTAGAVADVNKARAEMAKPDGHVEFAYGELNKDFGVLPTGDMAQAQFNLLTEAKLEIDAVGYNAAAAGKDKQVISGVALRQRTQASQTELAPMFNVLKNLDIRIYRKIWNRIKQYWKAEKWVRVTDDENNLKFVGLNKPMTRGEMMMKQTEEQMKSQNIPPQQMQQLMMQMQQKIQMDPSMSQVVSTQNDLMELDVDIIMDDAPDTVTQEVEDFQAMAEMVKSGFPIPPEAVIMSSPLSNKDKILKMMKEQPQIPPKMQEAMKKMQEQLQKLSQENQALKSDQQTEQAKLQYSVQEEQAKLQLKQQEAQANLAMEKVKQESEIQLAREKAQAEIELKRMIAEADLQLEAAKLHQQAAIEGTKLEHQKQIEESKMSMEKEMSDREHMMKVEQENRAQEENVAPKILQTLARVVKGQANEKTISITLPDGRKVTADVSLQKAKQEADAELERIMAQTDTNYKRKLEEQKVLLEKYKKDAEAKAQLEKVALEEKMNQDKSVMMALTEQLGNLNSSLQQQISLQKETLQAIKAPSSVSIGGIQKDSAGNIVGATVNKTIQ